MLYYLQENGLALMVKSMKVTRRLTLRWAYIQFHISKVVNYIRPLKKIKLNKRMLRAEYILMIRFNFKKIKNIVIIYLIPIFSGLARPIPHFIHDRKSSGCMFVIYKSMLFLFLLMLLIRS